MTTATTRSKAVRDGCRRSLDGGIGQDAPSYTTRTAALTITIGDESANDGESGEGDQVLPGVEVVRGGSGNDSLTGDAAANMLIGNNGDDTLVGSDGNDTLQGGSGANTLQGGNDDDQMDAGTGADVFQGGAGTLDFVDYGARAVAVTSPSAQVCRTTDKPARAMTCKPTSSGCGVDGQRHHHR